MDTHFEWFIEFQVKWLGSAHSLNKISKIKRLNEQKKSSILFFSIKIIIFIENDSVDWNSVRRVSYQRNLFSSSSAFITYHIHLLLHKQNISLPFRMRKLPLFTYLSAKKTEGSDREEHLLNYFLIWVVLHERCSVLCARSTPNEWFHR